MMLVDSSGDQLNPAFVQYVFTGEAHSIISKPHGNSKSKRPFIRTAPSTLQKLKECRETLPPRQTVNEVTKMTGGIIKALKRKTDYKVTDWPNFFKLAKELVDEQEEEIEKAIIAAGEYSFASEYKHLELSVSKWASMSQTQRKKYIYKIKSFPLVKRIYKSHGPYKVKVWRIAD